MSKKLLKNKFVKNLLVLGLVGSVIFAGYHFQTQKTLKKQVTYLDTQNMDLNSLLDQIENELEDLKSQDQYIINQQLQEEIDNINKTYKSAVSAYEDLLDLKDVSKETEEFDKLFANSLVLLSERNYASASAELQKLVNNVKTEIDKIVSSFTIPKEVSESNTPPGSGYSRQSVKTDVGTFMVSIVSADLNSTRIIVDTASDSDCSNDCPVLPLSEYVKRNNAYAGINGSYFCPASYPSCAGRTNSFDTLLMNKNKTYFNSGNNVYSNVPAVIFHGNSARFVQRSLEWGRDTGVDAVIANQPLLTFNNAVAFGGDDDPKKGSKGNRSFVGVTGSAVYIGVVHNATVAEAARVAHALGIHNTLNLDNGGSTALWHGGYKVGPGRNLPNVVLFVKK